MPEAEVGAPVLMFPRYVQLLGRGCVIVSVAAVTGELALRVYDRLKPSFIFGMRSKNYERMKAAPHARLYDFPMNADGYHDEEFVRDKPPLTYRIIAVGDSFAFGVVPYDYNYLTRLEKRLAGRRPRVEIYNMGVSSIGLDSYRALLVNEGQALQPDMVLLNFYVGNDFYERIESDRLTPRCYVLTFLRALAAAYKVRTYHSLWESGYCDDCPSLPEDEWLWAVRNLLYIFHPDYGGWNDYLGFVREHLRAIKQACDAWGVSLVVAILPSELQVSPDLRRAAFAHYPGKVFVPPEITDTTPQAFDFHRPNDQLVGELEKLGIQHIDLLPAFESAGRTEVLYVPNNSHWNIRGNRLGAEVLESYLVARLPATSSDAVR